MSESAYLLDTNVFIQAARGYYAFDLAPRFWASLLDCAADGRVASIDRVKAELVEGQDDLADWAKSKFDGAFLKTDEPDVLAAYSRIIVWVQKQQQFTDAAKVDFARIADGWLVAYALAKGRTVVTHEGLAPEAKNRVPIPNICNAFGVKWMNTFYMLREIGIQFA